MSAEIISPITSQLHGTIQVPGDKSISHRALILGAICQGTLTVNGLLAAEDVGRTRTILKNLGVKMEESGGRVQLHGIGPRGFTAPQQRLYCGNSGTTLRLMTGLLAGQNFQSELTGDASLNRRPMGRVIQPLTEMGATIEARGKGGARTIHIIGQTLHGIDYTLPVASAQVKSALLLAGLTGQGTVRLKEPYPSRDHSERILAYLGAALEWGPGWVSLEPGALQAHDLTVPGDFSSAAFLLVAALLVPGSELTLTNVSVNPTRTGLLKVLLRMGAKIRLHKERSLCGEPVADLLVRSSSLTGTHVAAEEIPSLLDEIPILAVAAASATGETEIRGAGELRVKESDRLHALATELTRLGARVSEAPDGLTITGPVSFRGGPCKSYGDHRMAMALAVAALRADAPTTLDDFSCVAISYPTFLQDLQSLI